MAIKQQILLTGYMPQYKYFVIFYWTVHLFSARVCYQVSDFSNL